MKRISTWALYHPKKARLLMVFLQVIVFFLAYYIGNRLQEAGLYLSDSFLYITGLLLFLAIISYPNKRRKKDYFEYRYYVRQKTNDFVIAVTSFFLLITAFNSNLFLHFQNNAYATSVVTPSSATVSEPSADGKKKKISAREWRQIKTMLKKQFKKLVVVKEGSRGQGKNKGLKLALAIVSGIIVTALLAALACSISCNGSGALAVIVLVLGLGGIVWGLIAWIKSIYRKKGSTTRRKKRIKDPVVVMNAS